MKTNVTILKIAVTLVLLLNVASLFAQDRITLNIAQDAKFLFIGDDRGNDAGTLDLLFRSEWQGKQTSVGYMLVAPEFEYSNLQGGDYRRYSLNLGYTLTFAAPFEFTATAGYGVIDRKHVGADFSAGAQLEAAFAISPNFKLYTAYQFTERSDLYEYGTPTRGSGFIGIKIGLFKTRGR